MKNGVSLCALANVKLRLGPSRPHRTCPQNGLLLRLSHRGPIEHIGLSETLKPFPGGTTADTPAPGGWSREGKSESHPL